MLTTDIFTPATGCLQPTYTISPAGSDVVSQLTAIRGYKSECYPFTSAETGFPTMSAIACPLQYSFLSRSETDGGTTFGTCCPSGGQINTRLASDLCTRYTGYTSATVVDATATSVVHNNWFVDTAIVVSWTYGEMPEKTSTSTLSSRGTTVPSAANGVVVTAPPAPSPGLPDSHRLRTTATTIAVAVGCAIGAVVLLGIILGLITLRRHRKQKSQAQARLDEARLGPVRVRNDMPPPQYEARQSLETLPGYEARNESRSSLAKM